MGVFNRVLAECPRCGCDVEFQSKAGKTECKTYTEDDVPIEIAKDIMGESQDCRGCGERFTIKIKIDLDNVKMEIS